MTTVDVVLFVVLVLLALMYREGLEHRRQLEEENARLRERLGLPQERELVDADGCDLG